MSIPEAIDLLQRPAEPCLSRQDYRQGLFCRKHPPSKIDVALWDAVEKLGVAPTLIPRSESDGEADTTDHVLQADLLRLGFDSPKSCTIALLTGDGAGINSGIGFLADAIRPAERGWNLEVYS